MSEAKFSAWNVLSLAPQACAYLLLALWIYLLSTICSSPSAPDAVTGNIIPYNCHGSMVEVDVRGAMTCLKAAASYSSSS
jgi:hypothetical protein